MTRSNDETDVGSGELPGSDSDEFATALVELETAILAGCEAAVEWPARVAAAVYAGVDFAIENPALARALTIDATVKDDCRSRDGHVIERLADLARARIPRAARPQASTDEALMAGIVGLVADHIRIGRLDRLAQLRPELVFLTLLPYLGFSEAQVRANQIVELRGDKA